ncbi:MAG: class I SAM-dependent methyltransferase [Pseudonocardiaceae bacterium]
MNRSQALRLISMLRSQLDRSPILDAGAGSGYIAILLAARGARVVALDTDYSRLAQLADRLRTAPTACKVDIVVASGEQIPFTSRTFELVFCNSVLEHVQDDRMMIAECARVLAPDGILALTVPDQSLRFGDRYQRFWHWIWSLPQGVKNLLLDSQLAATQDFQEAQECVEKKFDHRRRYRLESLKEILSEHHLVVVKHSSYLTRLGAFWHDIIIAFGLPALHALAYYGHLLNRIDRALVKPTDVGKGFALVAVREAVR